MTQMANTEQAEHWSGESGDTWVRREDMFDALMMPVLDLLFAEAPLAKGDRVLDIGCGTGISLLRAADVVGAQGQVTGVDVSTPMLSRAETRVQAAALDNVSCVLADAQVHDFGAVRFDRVISRFGVMFFEDPIAAFANIRNAMTPGATITFVTWSGMAHNPWFRVPAEVARRVVGDPPSTDPRAPGPMAFSEQGYVSDILTRAGFSDVSARAQDLLLTPRGDRSDVAEFAGREGPAGRIVKTMGGSEADVIQIETQLRKVFANYETPDGLRVPALINVFSGVSAG